MKISNPVMIHLNGITTKSDLFIDDDDDEKETNSLGVTHKK